MSKKEIKNLLKAGRPKTVVKQYRRDAIEPLQKFITDKDSDVRMNAIIAFSYIGQRIGLSSKQVEPFIKNLEKLGTSDVVIDAIIRMGDKAISPLIDKISQSKGSQKMFYNQILTKIGVEPINKTLLAQKITSPTEALRNEIILRLNSDFASDTSSYDPKFQYGQANIKEYKQLISKGLSSSDSYERDRALETCGSYPTITREFAGEITKLLGSNEPDDVQIRALNTLGELGSPDVVSAISKQLKASSDEIRIAAVKALGSIGKPMGIDPIIKNTLLDQNEFVRQESTNALGKIGAPAAKVLIDYLENDDYMNQVEIALKRIGEPAVKYLSRAMGHKNRVVRKNITNIAKMILTTKYGFSGTVVKLLELLKDKDEGVQEQVVETIVNMGDPALDAVIRAMGDQDTNIRDNSRAVLNTYALMNIELMVEATLKKNLIGGTEIIVLLAVYSDDDEIKDYAFSQLEALGNKEEFTSASGAISQAVIDNVLGQNQAFTDKDDDIRYSVAQIGFYLDKPIIPYLQDLLDDGNVEVVEVAIDSLGYLGEKAEIAVNQILSFSKSKNEKLRRSAIAALGSIGSSEAVPALLEAMGDDSIEIQETAAEAVDKMANQNPVIFMDSLSHSNPKTRENLVRYLSKFGQIIYEPLIERLTFNDPYFQEAASELIGLLGHEFGDVLMSEVRLIPNESAQLVAINGFAQMQYTPAIPYMMDLLRKKEKKITNAIRHTVQYFGEILVQHCLNELEKGGETMEKIIEDFIGPKSIDPQFSIIPIIEQIGLHTPKKDLLIDILKKINDKDVNQKLIKLLERNELEKARNSVNIVQSEPDLSKLADKIRKTIPQ